MPGYKNPQTDPSGYKKKMKSKKAKRATSKMKSSSY